MPITHIHPPPLVTRPPPPQNHNEPMYPYYGKNEDALPYMPPPGGVEYKQRVDVEAHEMGPMHHSPSPYNNNSRVLLGPQGHSPKEEQQFAYFEKGPDSLPHMPSPDGYQVKQMVEVQEHEVVAPAPVRKTPSPQYLQGDDEGGRAQYGAQNFPQGGYGYSNAAPAPAPSPAPSPFQPGFNNPAAAPSPFQPGFSNNRSAAPSPFQLGFSNTTPPSASPFRPGFNNTIPTPPPASPFQPDFSNTNGNYSGPFGAGNQRGPTEPQMGYNNAPSPANQQMYPKHAYDAPRAQAYGEPAFEASGSRAHVHDELMFEVPRQQTYVAPTYEAPAPKPAYAAPKYQTYTGNTRGQSPTFDDSRNQPKQNEWSGL